MNAVTSRVLSFATMPVLTAVATLASAAGVLAGPSPAAVAGGILLGFVLPGLALTEILFRHRTLSPVERAVLAPGLSLATLIVAGLLLYVSGLHLDRTSWTLATAGVTLAVLALTAVPRPGAATVRIQVPAAREAATEFIPVIRDSDAPPGKRTPRALPGPFAPWSAEHKIEVRLLIRQLLPMIMVVAVLAGAGYLSFASSRASYDVTVTTLSAAPPGVVNAAGNRLVEVTASGLVAGNGPYNLLVTDAGGAGVLERVIAVDAGGTWSAALSLPSAGRLTVGLFRAGDTSAYRTLLIAAAP
jgi:hypothetical protein